jgi:hypothetical protein
VNREALEWVFDRFLLLYLAAVILLVGLLLGWDTPLGRAMARYKVVLAAVFVGAAASQWFLFFASNPWRWTLRVGLVLTMTWAVWQFRLRFGSWREMTAYALGNLRNVRELVIWHRDEIG